MRRENSEFKMAFVSHEGTKLYNNDEHGAAELSKLAIYVVADGFEDGDNTSNSGKIAVRAAIAAFQQRPSMGKAALKRYMDAAHKALQDNGDGDSLKASMTIVVTDYQKLRYVHAGNTRFYLYRMGSLLAESKDHSLSWQLMENNEIPKDKIAAHEERNNLSCYLGQEGVFAPEISKKFKLQDGDIFTLLTRGMWEHIDSDDVKEALADAEAEPQKAVDDLERLMLDPHPENVDNYSCVTVFVNKVWADPNRAKRIKTIVTVSIIALVLAIILTIVLVILHNQRETKRTNMEVYRVSGIEYMADENFPRAKEEMDAAYKLAEDLKDSDNRNTIGNYQKLIEAVINADDLLAAGDYDEAQAAYLIAQDRSRYTDNLAMEYIERKLELVGNYISVNDLITLGDTLRDQGSYSLAEARYLEARTLAARIYYAEGKDAAIESLNDLYELMEQAASAVNTAAQDEAAALAAAAEMEALGDQAVTDGDTVSAKLYYDIARDRFVALEDDVAVIRIDGKLASIGSIEDEQEKQAKSAQEYVDFGDELMAAGDYAGAKSQYILARNIYSRLNDDSNLEEVQGKIETCEGYIG